MEWTFEEESIITKQLTRNFFQMNFLLVKNFIEQNTNISRVEVICSEESCKKPSIHVTVLQKAANIEILFNNWKGLFYTAIFASKLKNIRPRRNCMLERNRLHMLSSIKEMTEKKCTIQCTVWKMLRQEWCQTMEEHCWSKQWCFNHRTRGSSSSSFLLISS